MLWHVEETGIAGQVSPACDDGGLLRYFWSCQENLFHLWSTNRVYLKKVLGDYRMMLIGTFV